MKNQPSPELLATAKEEIITRSTKDGTAIAVYTRYRSGEWQARLYVKRARVELRYGDRILITGRGTVAWKNSKAFVDHFHGNAHVPVFPDTKCLADHPRPAWMAPPPRAVPDAHNPEAAAALSH